MLAVTTQVQEQDRMPLQGSMRMAVLIQDSWATAGEVFVTEPRVWLPEQTCYSDSRSRAAVCGQRGKWFGEAVYDSLQRGSLAHSGPALNEAP